MIDNFYEQIQIHRNSIIKKQYFVKIITVFRFIESVLYFVILYLIQL